MKKFILIGLILSLLNSKMIRDDSKDTVFDTRTKFMWQDNFAVKDTAKVRTFQEAIEYCEDLNMSTYTDWRLPNINELESITDYSTYEPSISNVFKYTANSEYWSSTTDVSLNNDKTLAWSIDFNTSTSTSFNKSTELYVRCIRDL